MTNVKLTIEGMSCGHCVSSVEGAVKASGASGKVNLASGTVEVQYNEAVTSIETIKEAIEEQGYTVV